MAEIPNVAPGETIESGAWGNPIRDRTVQRYASVASRDALNPTPTQGDLAYLEDTDRIQVFAIAAWVDLINAAGTSAIANDAPLNFFQADGTTVGAFLKQLASGTFQLRHDSIGGLVDRLHISSTGALTLRDPTGAVRLTVDAAGAGVQLAGITTLNPATADDGAVAMRIAIARAWQFEQSLTGASSRLRLYSDDNKTFEIGGNTNGTIVTFNNSNYRTGLGSNSASARNILIGTTVPDNAWGLDGDIFIRHTA